MQQPAMAQQTQNDASLTRYSRGTHRNGRLNSDTRDMGFNPTRKQVARKTDIWFVVAAVTVAFALVAWAFLG